MEVSSWHCYVRNRLENLESRTSNCGTDIAKGVAKLLLGSLSEVDVLIVV